MKVILFAFKRCYINIKSKLQYSLNKKEFLFLFLIIFVNYLNIISDLDTIKNIRI